MCSHLELSLAEQTAVEHLVAPSDFPRYHFVKGRYKSLPSYSTARNGSLKRKCMPAAPSGEKYILCC